MNKNKKGGNNLLMIILLLFILVSIFFFPKINDYIVKIKSPKIQKEVKNEQEDRKFSKEILESVHFPIMRSSVYSSTTYYSLDKFTIADMKNGDILLNAFLDIHEGNITNLGTPASCGGVSSQVNQKYLALRIKNILGRNINYKLENFEVPEGSDSKYVGSWSYDDINKRFIYNGKCNTNLGNIKYYDLKQLKEGKYEENDLILYYYLGFAKVEGNKYVIYSNPDMKEEIDSGDYKDLDNLQKDFEAVNNKKKKIYKYIFKDSICTYNEYCLYEGSWD